METFPKLYKKTSTGAIQEWEVYVDDTNCNPIIVTKYGIPRFPVGLRF